MRAMLASKAIRKEIESGEKDYAALWIEELDLLAVFEDNGELVSKDSVVLREMEKAREKRMDDVKKNGVLIAPLDGLLKGEALRNFDEAEEHISGAIAVVMMTKDLHGADILMDAKPWFTRLAEIWNTDLLIFPSSIHEIIALKLYDQGLIEENKNQTRNINATEVTAEEVLTDVEYIFRKDTGKYEIIRPDDFYWDK